MDALKEYEARWEFESQDSGILRPGDRIRLPGPVAGKWGSTPDPLIKGVKPARPEPSKTYKED